ncbi:hypothetical protein ACHAXS_005856 [Conticribra weissflogii]
MKLTKNFLRNLFLSHSRTLSSLLNFLRRAALLTLLLALFRLFSLASERALLLKLLLLLLLRMLSPLSGTLSRYPCLFSEGSLLKAESPDKLKDDPKDGIRVALSSSLSPELLELDFFNTWKIAGGTELLLGMVCLRK